jgi:hypothetical protein
VAVGAQDTYVSLPFNSGGGIRTRTVSILSRLPAASWATPPKNSPQISYGVIL